MDAACSPGRGPQGKAEVRKSLKTWKKESMEGWKDGEGAGTFEKKREGGRVVTGNTEVKDFISKIILR